MLTTSEIFHDTRILNQAKTLAKKYDVTIIGRKYSGQKIIKFPFKIKLIKYLKLPLFKLNILSSLISIIKATWRQNPDIYHAHDLDGLVCAFPAALLKRKILIYDSHELWSKLYPFENLKGIQWLLAPLEKLLIWRINKGITVNNSIGRYLKNKYHKDFITLYNVADLTRSQKSQKPTLNKRVNKKVNIRQRFPHQKIILHLGAADEGRGLEQIIQAAKFLPKNFVIIFIGGGKTQKIISQLVKDRGLETKIYLLPAVLPSDINSIIKQADLGLALSQKISLSYYYSLPNKIFQYLAANLPILGSNFPEFKKIILKNKIGEVVDPSNPRLISQKIQTLTSKSNQKKFRHHLYGLAKSQYNWYMESQKLLKLYQDLEVKCQINSKK